MTLLVSNQLESATLQTFDGTVTHLMNFGRTYTTLSEDLSKQFLIPAFGSGSSNARPSMVEYQASSIGFLECNMNQMRSTIQRLDREDELPALWWLSTSRVISSRFI